MKQGIDKAKAYHIASAATKGKLLNMYFEKIERINVLEKALMDVNLKNQKMEELLRAILEMHEVSAVDWDAMRKAKELFAKGE